MTVYSWQKVVHDCSHALLFTLPLNCSFVVSWTSYARKSKHSYAHTRSQYIQPHRWETSRMSGSRTRLQAAAEAGCSEGSTSCNKNNSEKIVSARNRHSSGALLSGFKGGVTWSSDTASSNMSRHVELTEGSAWLFECIILYPSSKMYSCFRLLPPFTTENMSCRWYIFHRTTHTSPYRRQIGKHIWR